MAFLQVTMQYWMASSETACAWNFHRASRLERLLQMLLHLVAGADNVERLSFKDLCLQ